MPTSPGHRALDLLTDALAAHRLTTLLVEDENPVSDAARDAVRAHGGAWAGAIDCQRCTSVWVGAAIGLARLIPGWRYVAVPLALSGAVSLAAELLGETTTGFTEPQGAVAPARTPAAGGGPLSGLARAAVAAHSRPLNGPPLTDLERTTGQIHDEGGARSLAADELHHGRRVR